MISAPGEIVHAQVAPPLQVTSQVEPVGHANLHVLLSSHVSLHVRFVAQPKSHVCPALHVHSFPQLPFVGPGGPESFAGVVPEDDDDEEVEDDEDDVPEAPDDVDDDGVTRPPSPSLATFQS